MFPFRLHIKTPCLISLLLLLGLPVISAPVTASEKVVTALEKSYTAARSEALQQKIRLALEQKGPDYRPRTQHLDQQRQPEYTNRLILQNSPYLLQHAHNPVDWHPWGSEALALAEKENKPVLLSIGYSTCHWCHVMEEESFENEQIADYINRHFIAIKVDREQHPDIDETYMMASQLISQRGGWPLTAFLTPAAEPFFAATYYPAEQFFQLLQNAHSMWQKDQEKLSLQAGLVVKTIQQIMQGSRETLRVGRTAIRRAQALMLSQHDELSGGFGEAPKFPQESMQFFLIRLIEQNRDDLLTDILRTNLDAMQEGGIYDQIGGGFHRYATDPEWLVPHFEKMLYNQGLLARVYLHGWRVTGIDKYQRTVRETLNYVLREMTSSNGGFYSATDADSEGEEGRFFIWTEEQIRHALPGEDAELALMMYGVTPEGNFETDTGNVSILHLPQPLESLAEQEKIPLENLYQKKEKINRQLLKQRQTRIPPLLDDKLISAWNGMMITALAEAGLYMEIPEYTAAAVRAAEMMWMQCRDSRGGLLRICSQQGEPIAGTQEDYAYFAQALITLYDVTGERYWLERAIRINQEMHQRFWDDHSAGFFLTEKNIEALPLRPRSSQDGAIPSGNSIAHEVLQKLYTRTGREHYNEQAEQLISQASAFLSRQPMGQGYLLASLLQQRQGESGSRNYAARGNVSLRGVLSPQRDELVIALDIENGWHINSNQPLQKNLMATRVSLIRQSDEEQQPDSIIDTLYPEAITRALSFQRDPLSLFEGNTLIRVPLRKPLDSHESVAVSIELQACNDRLCLPPETLELSFIAP